MKTSLNILLWIGTISIIILNQYPTLFDSHNIHHIDDNTMMLSWSLIMIAYVINNKKFNE